MEKKITFLLHHYISLIACTYFFHFTVHFMSDRYIILEMYLV